MNQPTTTAKSLCYNCLRWRPADKVEVQDRGEGEVQVCRTCSHGESLPTLLPLGHD